MGAISAELAVIDATASLVQWTLIGIVAAVVIISALRAIALSRKSRLPK